MDKNFAELRDNLLVQAQLLDRLDRKVESNVDAIAETNRAWKRPPALCPRWSE